MNRKTFRAFLNENFGMTDDVIMDRLFKNFNRLSRDDIDTEEWILGFSVFLRGPYIYIIYIYTYIILIII